MDLESKFIKNLNAFGPFEKAPHIAIAVSGGADSMALALFTKLWAEKNNAKIIAITFDHNYREESHDEAQQVSKWLKNLNIKHIILKNSGKKPNVNIQEAARLARYNSMSEYCENNDIFHLLLGQHMDDQAETFLNHLARGSGASGLAGMAKISAFSNVQLLRPLLNFSKDNLKNYLKENNQKWLEDPSNKSPEYTRNRIRAALGEAEDEGLLNKRIAESASHLSHSRQMEEKEVAMLLAQYCEYKNEGYLILNNKILQTKSKLLPLIISKILTTTSGNEKPPRQEKVRTLLDTMKANNISHKSTLHGCKISKIDSSWKFEKQDKNNKQIPARPLAGLSFDCYAHML